MSSLPEDRDLLEAFRVGQPRALERVYREYCPTVSAYLGRGIVLTKPNEGPRTLELRDPFELEACVQETFLRAFSERARLSYDGLRPYRDFLLGIARHVVIDEIRRRMRVRVIDWDDSALTWTIELDPPTTQDEDLEQKEAIVVVRQFLSSECNERDRKLYDLRFREERSQHEVAKAAGLTRIQVRRWETKFRKRLLKYLKRNRYV